MNPKILKLRDELSRNKAKIADLQARDRDLEKLIKELENIDIIGLVRTRGLTLEQFMELMQNAAMPDAAATTVESKKEVSEHEET